MFRKSIYLLFLGIFLTIGLFAERVVLDPSESSGVSYNVVESTDDYTIIEIKINNYAKDTVDIEGDKYLNISVETAGVTLEKGFPSLPLLAKSLIIGHDSQMHLEVLKANYTEFSGRIAPSKGHIYRSVNPADIPYTFDDIYKQDVFYPEEIARLTEPYVMRELRGIAFQILPVSVNSAKEMVRLYHHTIIKVYSSGVDFGDTTLSGPPTLITRDFIEIYSTHFLNYNHFETRYNSITEQGSILVICYADFITAMEPYVAWKRQKGIPTTMVDSSTAGSTATAIKTFISSYYTANPTTAFIQFVGDSGQIPPIVYSTGYGYWAQSGPADPNFGMVVGGVNDYYPDILIGRFSAQSVGDVNTQVARTIQYERDLNATATWITKAMGIASNEGAGYGHPSPTYPNGESDEQHMSLIRSNLLAYGYQTVDEIYHRLNGSPTQVVNALNLGRSYINYAGHGDTNMWYPILFYNSHINSLSNTGMLPFIISVACNNGKFDASQICFAETWMRATTNSGQPTGAVATFMCSIEQDWEPPMTTQDTIVELLIGGIKHTFGGLVYNAQSAMLDQYNNSSGREVVQTWNLFGDASLMVRTRTPYTMHTQIPLLPLSDTSYTMSSDADDALVCIYRPDTNTIVASTYTNDFGQATLNVTSVADIDCPLILTVTAFDATTFVTEIERGHGVPGLPYIENFDSGTNLIALGWDGDIAPTFSGIKPISGINNTNGLTLYVDSSFATQYAYTPTLIGNPTATTHVFAFVYRLVEFTSNWALPLTAKVLGAEDKVYIEMSTTGPNGDYTVLQEINDSNHTPSTEFRQIAIQLAHLNYESINFRFRVVRGSGDWIAVFDNIYLDMRANPPYPPAVYTIDRTAHIFPNTPIRGTSQTQRFTIKNIGSSPLSITSITLAGTNANQFTLTNIGSMPTALEQNQIKTFGVSFTPTDIGNMTANIIILHNAPGSTTAVSLSGTSEPTSSGDDATSVSATTLKANYPNPFNPTTTIWFDMAIAGQVSIDIYNTKGQKVKSVLNETRTIGSHTVTWNGMDDAGNSVSSGIYFYRMTTSDFSGVRKMILMK